MKDHIRLSSLTGVLVLQASFLVSVGCNQITSNESDAQGASTSQNLETQPATAEQASYSESPGLNNRETQHPITCSIELQEESVQPGSSLEVRISIVVDSPYEISGLEASFPVQATTLELKLPQGFQEEGEWTAPPVVRSSAPDGHSVYVGEIAFTRKITIEGTIEPGDYEIGCEVLCQACRANMCLRPNKFELSTSLPVR